MNKNTIFTYIASIVIGLFFFLMQITNFNEDMEIRYKGVQQKVVLESREYVNKMYIAKVRYKEKVYDYYGGGTQESIGDTLILTYNSQKDEFATGYRYTTAYYLPILLWLFLLVYGLIGVTRLLICRVK